MKRKMKLVRRFTKPISFLNKIITPTILCISIALLLISLSSSVLADPLPVYQYWADENYPPFEFKDPSGEAAGFSVDILRAIGEETGFEINVTPHPWTEVKEALTGHTIDLSGTMVYDLNRTDRFVFSVPITTLNWYLYVPDNSSINSLKQLIGKRIILAKGDIWEEKLKAENFPAEITIISDYREQLKQLSIGGFDAAIINKPVASYLMEDEGIKNIKPSGEAISRLNLCIAAHISDPTLINRVNEGIIIITRNGKYDEISKKWFAPAQREIESELIRQIFLYVLLPILGIVGVILLWNRSLQKIVTVRTADLRMELSVRESVENALRKSERRYQSLFMEVPVALYRIDSGGNFLDFNPALQHLLVCPDREILLQMKLSDFIEDSAAGWHPNDSLPDSDYSLELRIQTYTGLILWAQNSYKSVKNNDGSIRYYNGSLKNITARKRVEEDLIRKNEEIQAAYEEILSTEEELRSNYEELAVSQQALEESENRYSLTLESINDGLWDLNILTGALFFSPQFYRMSGYEPGAFPADVSFWISQIHPEDQERVQEAFKRTVMGGDELAVEYRTLRREGTYQWIQARGNVIEFDKNRKPLRIVGTHTDITERKEIEATLEENRRTLQTLMDNLPGMVYRCLNDRDWTMEVVSDGAFSLTGYRQYELLNNRDISFGSIIHPDDREMTWEYVQSGVTQNKPYKLTYRIICKDGTVKWVWEQGRGIFKGDVLWALEGYITDITSEIKAQKALQTMGYSIEHLKEGIFWFNSEGIIFDANIAFLDFSSESRESIIGLHIANLPFILHRTNWSELMLQAKNTGSVTEDALLNHRSDHQKNLRISISYGVFGDDIVFCGIINDRTQEEASLQEVLRSKEELASAYEELLSAEEALKEQYLQLVHMKDALQKSESKYRSIFEDAILGIFQATPEGSFNEINPAFARIYGFDSPDEMKALLTDIRNQMYVHPEDRDELLSFLNKYGEVRGFEYEGYHKDGSSIWVSMNEKVIRDDDGEILYLEGTIEDITWRKKAEQEREISLKQIRKNFAEFSILNDGIRNPLTIIAILSESMETQVSDQITEQIRRIDDLINQLDMRWMESDKVIHYLQKHHNY